MSVPARSLPPSVPAVRRSAPVPGHDRAHPARTPAARPLTSSPPTPLRRARRGSPLAFWVLTSVVLGSMVVGIVSVSALLVQGGFRTEAVRQRIAALSDEQEALALEVAELSSPARVQYWATRVGLAMPERVVVLRVTAASGDRPA